MLQLPSADFVEKVGLGLTQRLLGSDLIAELHVRFAVAELWPLGQSRAVGVAGLCKTNPCAAHCFGEPVVGVGEIVGMNTEIADERRAGSIGGVGQRLKNVGDFGRVERTPIDPLPYPADARELILIG